MNCTGPIGIASHLNDGQIQTAFLHLQVRYSTFLNNTQQIRKRPVRRIQNPKSEIQNPKSEI
jgi:hypothetical protein